MKRIPLFRCVKPCGNCPYLKSSPVRLWHRSEFEKVLEAEASPLGSVFLCHKNNGGVCVGWLMDQDRRNHPSIMLRIALNVHGVTRSYLDRLRAPSELYPSVRAMIRANFPALLRRKGAGKQEGGGR